MGSVLRVYRDCLERTPRGLLRAPWVLALPMLYGLVSGFVAGLVAPLGIIGSFVMGFVEAALAASFLHVIDELVSGSKLRPNELLASTRRYLWPVINVLFIFWIAQMVAGPAFQSLPNGGTILLGVMAILAILLNATPEVIYQKRPQGGLATLQESVRFIQAHWIEWLIPNLLFGAALLYGVPRLVARLALHLGPTGFTLVLGLAEGFVLLPVMVFRGHLFRALDSGAGRRKLNLR